MRDLGRRISRSSTRKNPRKRLVFAVVIISAVVGIGFNLLPGSSEKTNTSSNSAIVLQNAPNGLKGVEVGKLDALKGGVDLATQEIILKDVKYHGGASGIARRAFGGGEYLLTVDASMPDPVNTHYQVWVVNGKTVTPIDFMRGSKTSWSLSLRDVDKFSQYPEIWVTLERTKDEKPEEHVLEGKF